MITINKQPTGIVLDSDISTFEVYSNNTNCFIKLSSNIITLDRLNVPRYNANNAIVDIRFAIKNKHIVTTHLTNNVAIVNNLFDITGAFNEVNGDNIIHSKTFTPFKIMYSDKSIETIRNQLYFAGSPITLSMSSNATLSVPFFNNIKGNIAISLTDNKDHLYHFELLENLDPGYYVFYKDLSLPYSTEALKLKVKGNSEIIKPIRILKNKLNKPVNVRYRNQFGATLYCQLFADLELEEELKTKVYKDQNGSMYTAEIDSSSIISITTGYLLQSELFLITQILNSLLVEIEINGVYRSVIADTKKVTIYKNNQFMQSNKLTFKLNNYEAN
ncbi:hypothetical protein HX071_08535 [Myroides marinus]|uniref:hypothetical protein n=1 Tax=Myroides marinus TaxID=703342 RepID=UPI0025754389|nr:hypothetical protein [Myroides marinus]MDM1502250.1 hypothetical protein [Myroides marinus]